MVNIRLGELYLNKAVFKINVPRVLVVLEERYNEANSTCQCTPQKLCFTTWQSQELVSFLHPCHGPAGWDWPRAERASGYAGTPPAEGGDRAQTHSPL